jgi:hypothetical protein
MKTLKIIILLLLYLITSVSLLAQEKIDFSVFKGYWFNGDSCFDIIHRLILSKEYVTWESTTGKHEYYKFRIIDIKITNFILVINYDDPLKKPNEKLIFRLNDDGKMEFKGSNLFRCPQKALVESILYDIPLNKYESFLHKLRLMKCDQEDLSKCIDEVWVFFDVSADGKLSSAEISRLISLVLKSLSSEDLGKPNAKAYDKTKLASQIFKGVNIFSQAVLNNYDYNNDNLISKHEIFYDVTIEKLAQLQIGSYHLSEIFKFWDKEELVQLQKEGLELLEEKRKLLGD